MADLYKAAGVHINNRSMLGFDAVAMVIEVICSAVEPAITPAIVLDDINLSPTAVLTFCGKAPIAAERALLTENVRRLYIPGVWN
jgi:hypothetical protein